MTIFINPHWRRQEKKWILNSPNLIGFVYPQDTMDYKWEVRKIDSSQIIEEGSSPDRIIASSQVEKRLNYLYFVEPEYEMNKGCRCGCCEDPTGKWKVWNRDDTINELFDSEEAAIRWLENKHGEIVYG